METQGLRLEDIFGNAEDFDINEAFQLATTDVLQDEDLVLEERIAHIEHIVTEANSDIYRDFVDLRAMATQIDMMCQHDHSFADKLAGNELVQGVLNDYHEDHGHDHHDDSEEKKKSNDKDKKKKKKRLGWTALLLGKQNS